MKYLLIHFSILFCHHAMSQSQMGSFNPHVQNFKRWKTEWANTEFKCKHYYYTDSINFVSINRIKQDMLATYDEYKSDSANSIGQIQLYRLSRNEINEIYKYLSNLPVFKNTLRDSNTIYVRKDSVNRLIEHIKNLPSLSDEKICFAIYSFSKPVYLKSLNGYLVVEVKNSLIEIKTSVALYKLQNNQWLKDTEIWTDIQDDFFFRK